MPAETEYMEFEIQNRPVVVQRSYETDDLQDGKVLSVQKGGTGYDSVDPVPMKNSPRMVTSGGVYEAVQSVSPIVDNVMSDNSANAVQNKVIKKYVDSVGTVQKPVQHQTYQQECLGNAQTQDEAQRLGNDNIGTDLKPIKIVAGIAKPVTTELLDTDSPQYVSNKIVKDDDVRIFKWFEEENTASAGLSQDLTILDDERYYEAQVTACPIKIVDDKPEQDLENCAMLRVYYKQDTNQALAYLAKRTEGYYTEQLIMIL